MLKGAGGGLCHGFGQPGGAAFRDDDSAGSGGVRGADDCTQVVRIFHAVEDYEKLSAGFDAVQFRVLLFGADGHHALVGLDAGHAIQRAAILEPDWRAGGAGQIDDFLKPVPARAPGD